MDEVIVNDPKTQKGCQELILIGPHKACGNVQSKKLIKIAVITEGADGVRLGLMGKAMSGEVSVTPFMA